MSYIGSVPTTASFPFDQFSGDGSTTAFTLTYAPASPTSIIVAISGVVQNPNLYSVIGTTITFSPAPPTGTNNISVLYLGLPVIGVSSPGNTAYFSSTSFTATASQTTFTPSGSYTVGFINVIRNGSQLAPADYTATNGTTVVLNNACTAGDIVVIEVYTLTSISNALPLTGGTVTGASTFNSTLTVNGAAVSGFTGFKNRIINPGMVIDQRNAGASITPSGTGQYTVDRWLSWEDTDGTATVQRSTTAPAGFTNSLLFTVGTADATLAATQYAALAQWIEGFNVADFGWGTANAQTVTLSFWVRSSVTGTFGGAFRNNANDRNYAYTYTISSANTWEYKTVTVPGDTSGTWTTDNSAGIKISWGLGVGSTYSGTAGAWTGGVLLISASGATNLMATAGATFYLTGVQLERGSNATSFEFRDYGRELALCYRYAWNFSSALSSNGAFLRYLTTRNTSTTAVAGTLILPVEMRVTPTLTTTGTASNYAVIHTGGTTACSAVPAIGGDGSSRFSVNLEASVASGLTSGQGSQLMSNNNQTSYLLFASEL